MKWFLGRELTQRHKNIQKGFSKKNVLVVEGVSTYYILHELKKSQDNNTSTLVLNQG